MAPYRFGVRADMFVAEARRLCPALTLVGYEFDKYEEASIQVGGWGLARGPRPFCAVFFFIDTR